MKIIYLLCALGISADSFAYSPATSGVAPASHHGVHGGQARGAQQAWTTLPLLTVKMRGEGERWVVPQNIVADQITAYSNAAQSPSRPLPLDMAGAKLDGPTSGGFHWLTARQVQADQVRVASTVHYYSQPGKNPTAMLMLSKNELELIPQPFPREHSRYRANEDWRFLVRLNDVPLPKQPVQLVTQNGSSITFTSDDQGAVRVHFPNDFKAESSTPTGEHGHGRRSAGFVLATEYQAAGKHYLTSFNHQYGADAFDQRNLAMGLGFVMLGMLSALPLLRQRKTTPQEENHV